MNRQLIGEEKQPLMILLFGLFVLWIAITIMQWISYVNYDPCSAPSWSHDPGWCYFNSRYSLVETIINQGKWILSLKVI
jgi:hypothetical protein